MGDARGIDNHSHKITNILMLSIGHRFWNRGTVYWHLGRDTETPSLSPVVNTGGDQISYFERFIIFFLQDTESEGTSIRPGGKNIARCRI